MKEGGKGRDMAAWRRAGRRRWQSGWEKLKGGERESEKDRKEISEEKGKKEEK